jgi:hypothetical protein
MKLLRPTDIITLKQGEIEVDFSPLKYEHSLELSKLITTIAGKSVVDQGKQTALIVKYCVKEMRGVKDYSDEPIILRAGPNGMGDEDITTVINVLINTPFLPQLTYISTSATPKELEGVELKINGKVVALGN